MVIRKDTPIEEIVEAVPEAAGYLVQEGIQCIVCGEPVWGTLEETARAKGFNDADIDRFVAGINALAGATGSGGRRSG